MSRLQRAVDGVTAYPAVGKACPVRIWDAAQRKEITYWLGHVWIGERAGQYLRPRETIQAANLDAINAVIALKGAIGETNDEER